MTFLRKAWIWLFFLGFVLFLLSSSPDRGKSWNPLEQLFVEATAPFQDFFSKTVQMTRNFWMQYFYLVGVREDNAALKEEIEKLKIESQNYHELLMTHERLEKLLDFRKTIDAPVLAARVVGRDPSGWFKSIIIDKGAKDGLAANMPIVNASGLVGRIVALSPHYAKVLLLIDQNSAVDVLIQSSRDRGIIRGLSADLCELDYVTKSSAVQEDDAVITSGLGGVFPKGVPVGKVSSVKDTPGDLFKDIRVKPAVDFSKLEEVLIVLKRKEETPSVVQSGKKGK